MNTSYKTKKLLARELIKLTKSLEKVYYDPIKKHEMLKKRKIKSHK